MSDSTASSTAITATSAPLTGLPAASLTVTASEVLAPGASLSVGGAIVTASVRCLGGTDRSMLPTP